MEIEKHIQNLKDYIRIDKDNINYDDSDFSQFCKSHCEDIQAILDYIEKLEKDDREWYDIADDILRATSKYGEISIGEIPDYIDKLEKEIKNKE